MSVRQRLVIVDAPVCEGSKVFVAMAYVDYEGGALCGVYSSREAAEAAATLIPYADDRIVHEVTIDAAPLERSP